ncbi:hypothetical protein SAMN05518871_109143 [Psychrobacillus sp. OK028]|uniref:hypothetical protein n=1 Tax=Psychrobacillus sp. OK028 TaxID=1884359 RepID=UPI0008906E8C|nr:hypothetical protein [Psychrobacillus sp. OK028]SDO02809.1 hypothetical protein SAMN05518871_109143 [Psychrobacillus sp. OK028]
MENNKINIKQKEIIESVIKEAEEILQFTKNKIANITIITELITQKVFDEKQLSNINGILISVLTSKTEKEMNYYFQNFKDYIWEYNTLIMNSEGYK